MKSYPDDFQPMPIGDLRLPASALRHFVSPLLLSRHCSRHFLSLLHLVARTELSAAATHGRDPFLANHIPNLVRKELLSHLRTLRLVVALVFTVVLCLLTT